MQALQRLCLLGSLTFTLCAVGVQGVHMCMCTHVCVCVYGSQPLVSFSVTFYVSWFWLFLSSLSFKNYLFYFIYLYVCLYEHMHVGTHGVQ